MSRKTRREIEREVEDLNGGDRDEYDPLVFAMTNVLPTEQDELAGPESVHAELTVQPFPEKKPDAYKIATPNFLPKQYARQEILFVVTCANADHYGADRSRSNTVTACDLWEPLSEEDLRAEKRFRLKNDEPIPPLLAEYEIETSVHSG